MAAGSARLNPHLHLVALDGAWYEDGGELAWEGLSHLGTSITLKKAYTDGTVAVDMDPLSLLCRLATSVAPLPTDPGRSCWRAPSPWTSSPVPLARGG